MMGGWRHLTRWYGSIPRLMRAGLTLIAVGGAGDLGYHSLGRQQQPERLGYLVHVLTFAGMLLTVVGLMVEAPHGVRPPFERQD